MKVLIIGAGILGASLAFRLTRAEAEVTVLDAAAPASCASGRNFGWINASFYLTPAHHALRVQAMAAHHRLAADLPNAGHIWQGALWFEEAGQGMDSLHTELTALGYPVDILSKRQIALREPCLQSPPEHALHFPSEGAVDAAHLTRALLAASNAKLLSGIAAKSLIAKGDQITGVRSAIGPMLADHTVLAAGTATPALLQTIGLDLPMHPRPGLLLRTNPADFRLNHILVSPHQEIRQLPDGSLLAPCAANHQADAAETIPNREAAIAATLANLRALFGAQISQSETLLGHRPYPADGLPVLGQLTQGLSLAVMHSGVTLAPLAAEALSAEIMGQGAHALWSDYQPARLLRTK